MQMCFDCANKFGVRPMPPALRPPSPCAKCRATQFVRAIPREHTVDESSGRQNRQVSAPMFLTHHVAGSQGNSPDAFHNFAADLNPQLGFGQLEVYACVGCGAVEWYCHGVKDIPIHPHLMTERIDYSAGGPYR